MLVTKWPSEDHPEGAWTVKLGLFSPPMTSPSIDVALGPVDGAGADVAPALALDEVGVVSPPAPVHAVKISSAHTASSRTSMSFPFLGLTGPLGTMNPSAGRFVTRLHRRGRFALCVAGRCNAFEVERVHGP
jgi:hypothetical protein